MIVCLAGTERLESDIKMLVYLAGGELQLRKSQNTKQGAEEMQVYLAGECKSIESEIKKDMNIYLAESGGCLKSYLGKSILYKGANILQSFFYASDFTEKVIIPNCKNFLLDSGAFSFMQGKLSPDWNEYVDNYVGFINKNNIQHFFELDIDSIVGLDAVLDIRKVLEQKTGRKPIPVWHKSRGAEQFKKDASEYPYVAIGGIVSKEIKRSQYDVFPLLIDEAHRRGAKIHGLGFTNLEELKKYKFDSVDSTTWVSGNRFGAVYHFNGQTMKKIDKPEGKRVKTNKVAVHNFMEWRKFCDYAEFNL